MSFLHRALNARRRGVLPGSFQLKVENAGREYEEVILYPGGFDSDPLSSSKRVIRWLERNYPDHKVDAYTSLGRRVRVGRRWHYTDRQTRRGDGWSAVVNVQHEHGGWTGRLPRYPGTADTGTWICDGCRKPMTKTEMKKRGLT